ncbi:hypothetical protein DICA4_A05204 [Diutina catenulata]
MRGDDVHISTISTPNFLAERRKTTITNCTKDSFQPMSEALRIMDNFQTGINDLEANLEKLHNTAALNESYIFHLEERNILLLKHIDYLKESCDTLKKIVDAKSKIYDYAFEDAERSEGVLQFLHKRSSKR